MSKFVRWFIIICIVAMIVWLFREGAKAPASIMSFILFVAALTERVIRIRMLHRAGNGGAKPHTSSDMTRKEALEILELEEGASDDDIKKAHKRLITKIHPDTGGSKYLAAKINLARDVLLK